MVVKGPVWPQSGRDLESLKEAQDLKGSKKAKCLNEGHRQACVASLLSGPETIDLRKQQSAMLVEGLSGGTNPDFADVYNFCKVIQSPEDLRIQVGRVSSHLFAI